MELDSEEKEKTLITDATDLEFITFTDYNQTSSPETRKRVRSHVMHRVQQKLKNKKRKEKEGEVVLDLSLLQQADMYLSRDPSNSMSTRAVVPHPYNLGSGRSDSFTKYPIEMNVRTHELFDHLHGNTCPMFKTMSKIGFFRTVVDEAGFRQILCTSSSHITKLRQGTETAEAVSLSTEAIRSINRRLTDPALGISDGVIISILAFAYHAVMFNDIQSLFTHFNGLEEIIRRRGGFQALNLNQAIIMVLFWVDVNAAFIFDRSPRFPSPDGILPRINLNPLPPPSGPTLLQACLTDEMAHAVDELLLLNRFILSELTVRDLWDDGVFAGLHVVPVLGKLLSIRYEAVDLNPALARQEACRIGAILYLAGVRHRFGVNLAKDIYIPKLKEFIIAQDGLISENVDPILLWVLVIGGMQSFMHEEHKWYVSATANLIVRKQLNMWEELMAIMYEVLWIGGILEAECNEFQGEVNEELWTTYRQIFS